MRYVQLAVVLTTVRTCPEPYRVVQSPHISVAFRFVAFVVLAAAAGALWVALFRATDGTVTATPEIPSFGSKSIFAPAARPASRLPVSGVFQNGSCTGCSVHVGSGGLVRAEVPSGAGKRTAYALLDIGNRADNGPVLVHDVIGFGRGEAPAGRAPLLQVLDSSHRVIFDLIARPDRRLYLTSPPGGLRATPLVLATGAVVPNDGISGVAVDVAMKPNEWVLVSVNGLRTAAVHRLSGARTGAPRFLAAGVIDYNAPAHAAAFTATHAQVSVSTPSAPAAAAATPTASTPVEPTAQPTNAPTPLSSLSPPTISGGGVVGDTLTAAPGSWSDSSATFTYTWERCEGSGSCTAIDGAEDKTYELVPADSDAFVRVRVTAHAGGVSESRASAPVGPVNPAAPTALFEPSISGDAIVGSTLTADPGTWSDPAATLSYVWLRCDGSGTCTVIAGIDGSTFVLTGDDVGSSIEVAVTASNGGGSNEADSAPTGVVVPAAPVVVTAPSISGDAIVGSTLTADPGTWSDPAATLSYVWLRCDGSGTCTVIAGTDGSTFVLTGDDVGSSIEVAVTASNGGGSNEADSAPTGVVVPAAPVVVTAPSISGDAIVGSTLTADPGTWSDPAATLSYVWLRCDGSGTCTAIDGVDGSRYVLTGDDVGSSIEVAVTATNAGGTGTADSSPVGPVVLPAPPAVLTAPSVSGDVTVGSTLTADPGTWSDRAATLGYAWLRCHQKGHCSTIGGADGSTYVLTGDDLGLRIEVELTATNAGGAGTADSSPVGPVVLPAPPAVLTAPSVSGDVTVGSTLTADPGTWSDPAATLGYAWLRCHRRGHCSTIDGADGSTYLLTRHDVRHRIEVEVTATNAGGAGTADSSRVGPVVLPAPPAILTAPSVSGDVTVGSTLTADPGTWSDPAATLGYAWLRCDGSGTCTAIDGADASTYVLTGDDSGVSIEVEVTATSAGGTATADSTPTEPVGQAPPGDPPGPLAGDPSIAAESRSTRR